MFIICRKSGWFTQVARIGPHIRDEKLMGSKVEECQTYRYPGGCPLFAFIANHIEEADAVL